MFYPCSPFSPALRTRISLPLTRASSPYAYRLIQYYGRAGGAAGLSAVADCAAHDVASLCVAALPGNIAVHQVRVCFMCELGNELTRGLKLTVNDDGVAISVCLLCVLACAAVVLYARR